MTVDKNILILCLLLSSLAFAQPLQFQLQPGAFPASINGWQMYQPWAGGLDETTPELCDIDNDGDLDLFTGMETGYISYFQNIGTANQPDFLYETYCYDSIASFINGWGRSDINFVDIDADSDYDAFVGVVKVILYHNLGTATQPDFLGSPDTLFDINMNYISGHVDITDIDADGDYDLFCGTNMTGRICYYQNIGTQNNYEYELISQYWQNIQVNSERAFPCFGDLDSDGDLDLLVGTKEGKIYYHENQGTPQVPQMVYITNYFCNIDVGEDASPELVDIDGDGDLDLLVGRDCGYSQTAITQGDVFYYENVGTPQNYSFQFVTTNYLTFDNGNLCHPNLVDIDGDRDSDLLCNVNNHILQYRNQGTIGDPNFVYETDNYCGLVVPYMDPWFVDIDGDVDLDLFSGTSAIPGPPGLYLYLNQGTPQNPNYILYSNNVVPGVFTQASAIIVPGTGDIDGDGDQDLFVSDNAGYFYYWENVGTPTQFQFQYITNNWQNLGVGFGYFRHFCFYDIDHDGDLDLFIAHDTSPTQRGFSFYRNVGTPQNPHMVLEQTLMFPEFFIIQAAPYIFDIDDDGDGDLFVGDYWGGIRFFRNLEMENAMATEVTVSISENDVILTWQAVGSAEEYLIYYSSNPYFTPIGVPQAVVMPPDTSWTDENAVMQGKRYYRVVVEY
jgi:hypothetical protein